MLCDIDLSVNILVVIILGIILLCMFNVSINMLSDLMLIVKCQCQYAVSFCSSVIIINIIMLLGVCLYADCYLC